MCYWQQLMQLKTHWLTSACSALSLLLYMSIICPLHNVTAPLAILYGSDEIIPDEDYIIHRPWNLRESLSTVWLTHGNVQFSMYASSSCITVLTSSANPKLQKGASQSTGCSNSKDASAAQARCWHTQYPTKKPNTPHLWFFMNRCQLHSLSLLL